MARDGLLGFDIGGTKMAAVLGTTEGEIVDRRQFPSSCTPESARDQFITHARALIAAHPDLTIRACGISSPGPMSSSRGLLLDPPNMPGWRNVPMKQWVIEALNLPTAMENDANAGALAEWRWGFRSEVRNLIYLTCGTGMGSGLILDGRLYRGREDLAGEVGHIRLRPLGPVGFYKAGSLEGLTAGPALGHLARLRRQERHPPSRLDTLPELEVTGQTVGEAALAGDALAQEVVLESAGYLGEACALLIDLLNPERISLGSTARRLGSFYIEAVRAAARREAIPAAFEACTIDGARLGERVQDLAAIAIARELL